MIDLIQYIQEKYLIDNTIKEDGILLLDTSIDDDVKYDKLMQEFHNISYISKTPLWGFFAIKDIKISEIINAKTKIDYKFHHDLEVLVDKYLTWKDKYYEIYLDNGVIRIDIVNNEKINHVYIYKLKSKIAELTLVNISKDNPQKLASLNNSASIEAISIYDKKQNLVL